MRDNEIIKALKCCANLAPCGKCPLERDGNCRDTVIENALSLINRQRGEIIKLQNKNSKLRNERNRAKSEAIKEFAERLKTKASDFGFVKAAWDAYIDNLVKEMVGEDK